MPLHALPLRLSESTRRAGIDIDTSLHEAVGSDVPLRTLQPATRPPLLLVSSPASSSSSAFASASSSRPPSSPLGFPSSPATDPSSYASDAGTGPDAYQHLPSKLRLRKLKAEGKLRQQQKAPAASGKENVDSVTSSSKRAPGSPARNPFDNLPSTPAASPMHSPKHPPSSGAGRPSSTRRSARNGADSPFADVNSTPALPSTAVAAAPTAAFKSDSKHVPSALDSADVLRVPIMPNQSLVFGRKPDLSSIAPPTPQHTVHPVRVPNTFTHASRTHCICTLTAPPLGGLTMRITVMGTNGLMVDEERFEEGTSAGVELKRKQGEEVELGFYGNKRVVCEVKLEDMFGEGRATRGGPSASKGQDANPALASPRPKLRVDNKRKLKDDVAPSPPGSPASKKPRPSSIALEPTPAPSVPPLSPSILSLPPAERARSMVPHLNLDLPGLIAAAIVFNPRAMVKTDEVVRGVLEADPRMREALRLGTPTPTPSGPGVEKSSPGVEAQPASVGLGVSMMGEETKPDVSAVVDESSPGADVTVGLAEDEDEPRDERTERAVAAWRQVVLETLNEHDMFGCVTNEGLKDASGTALEALWYYQPQGDPDRERRATLTPAVKKLRTTQLTSKQYFFKKVRGARRKS